MFLFFRSFLALSLMFIFFSCGDSDNSSSPSRSPRASVDEAGDTRCALGLVWDEDMAVAEEERAADAEAEVDLSKSCRYPKTGYFVNDLGEEEACVPVENITAPALDESGEDIADTFNDGDFLPNAGPLAEDACPFECQTGYAKDALGRSCSIPPAGMYADADGKARQCNKIVDGDGKDADENPLYASFEDNTGPVSDPNGCPFACESGTRPAAIEVAGELLQPRVCNADGVGVYNKGVDEVVTQCMPIKHISRWIAPESATDSLSRTGPLTEDTCDYECQAGYLKGEIATDDDGPGANDGNSNLDRQCTSPSAGKYTDNEATEKDCDDDGTSGAPFTIPNGAYKRVENFSVPNENSCPFICNDGYIKTDEDGGTRSCSVPDPGYYADANGDKQTCGDIVNSKQVGGDLVTSAGSVTVVLAFDKCPFACETGYVKDETARTCTLPKVGYYADANGAALECTKIDYGNLVDSGGPVSGGAGACPFICHVGYVKNEVGRACTVPADGYYADADGNLQECTTEKSDIDYVNEIGAITQVGLEVADAANCPFNCLPGHIPDFNNRACAELGTGKFSDSLGQEGDCGGKPASSPGWEATQPVSVTEAAKCEFECAANRTADADTNGGTGSGSNCAVKPGYAVLAQDGGPGDPAGDKAATACTNGTVPNVAKNACIAPSRGYFAARADTTTDPGIETPCNGTIDSIVDTNNDQIPDHPVTSMGWETAQAPTVNTATACTFTCATGATAAATRSPVGTGSTGTCSVPAGHIVAAGPTTSPNAATTCNTLSGNVRQVPNDAKTACEAPSTGYFSDAGVETTCNAADADTNNVPDHPVTSTGWVTAQLGTVTSAAACAFQCAGNRSPDTSLNSGTGKDSRCAVDQPYVLAGWTGNANAATISCNTSVGNVRQVPNDAQTACENPTMGYFSDAGVKQPCGASATISPALPTNAVAWIATQPNTVTAKGSCQIATCASGYVKSPVSNSTSCATPGPGKYANSSGVETNCGSGTYAAGNVARSSCASCIAGNVVNSGKTTCGFPAAGHYADANRVETDCPGGTYATANNASRDGQAACTSCAAGTASTATGLTTACSDCSPGDRQPSARQTSCLSCNAGQVSSSGATACGNPRKGYYSSSTQVEISCTDSDNGNAGIQPPAGADDWVNPQPSGVTSAAACRVVCDAGKVRNSQSATTSCADPNKGYYSDSNRDAAACTDSDGVRSGIQPPTDATDWVAVQPSAVNSAGTCRIAGCGNGKVPNNTNISCVNPAIGYYSDNGVEIPCADSDNGNAGIQPPTDATGWLNPQPSTVTSSTPCRIAGCGNGKVPNNVSVPTNCNDPKKGHYSNSGVEAPCTDSDGSTAADIDPPANAIDWEDPQPAAVASAVACRISGCQNNTVPNATNTACVNPSIGHYSKNGVETPCEIGTYASDSVARAACEPCSSPTATYTNYFSGSFTYSWNTGDTGNTADTCEFTCNTVVGTDVDGTDSTDSTPVATTTGTIKACAYDGQ